MSASVEIMIVDDMPEHIQLATSILGKYNYKIRVATSGRIALKLIEKHQPTLILLDIQMPELDGFELCKIIKAQSLWRDIPIIFTTASNDQESIKRGFELGAQDYVIKPFNAIEFVVRINTHIKLTQQATSLKESYEELDKFCYTVSHDLKSPLHIIKQLGELINKEYASELSGDGAELMRHLIGKTDEVIKMGERLLEFSKMCKVQPHLQDVDLSYLFNETISELKSLNEGRIVHFNMDKLPTITGDRIMFKLLVMNILTNAFKFTKTRVETKITVTCIKNENEYIISTKDNGVGFDKSYAHKLFNVFQRLHTLQEFEGAGVGLAIIQRILQRHNGRVWITGEVEAGAELSFAVPDRNGLLD